jgi:hypothetical protein
MAQAVTPAIPFGLRHIASPLLMMRLRRRSRYHAHVQVGSYPGMIHPAPGDARAPKPLHFMMITDTLEP